mmetsp:Transcript_25071/g.74813  ORF Transcript_25071/g.74813 Transcript_25071/m.74813 type:complete len:219 (-) Transcript_25071:149-805(-)
MWRRRSPGLLISTLAAFGGGPALPRSGAPRAGRFSGEGTAPAEGLAGGLRTMSVGRKSGGLKGMDFTAVGLCRGLTGAFAAGASLRPGGGCFSPSSSHRRGTTTASSSSSTGASSSKLSTLSHCTSSSFRHSSSNWLTALLTRARPAPSGRLLRPCLASAWGCFAAAAGLSRARAFAAPFCVAGEEKAASRLPVRGFRVSAALSPSEGASGAAVSGLL